jgi:hypothetical protein
MFLAPPRIVFINFINIYNVVITFTLYNFSLVIILGKIIICAHVYNILSRGHFKINFIQKLSFRIFVVQEKSCYNAVILFFRNSYYYSVIF